MKKKQLTAKKTLSVFLAVLMLMTSWVFFPGMVSFEAEAIDAGDAVKATNQALLDQINTNAPDTTASTTYYQYKIYGNGDVNSSYNTEANRNEYFKKILSVSTQTVTDINSGSYFTGVPNTDQNVSVVYPSMVLRYDGSGDKPRFGLLFQGDANSGNKMGFQYAKLTTNTSEFTFNPGYWKGIAANDSCFFYIMKGASEGAYMSAQTTTSGAAFNSRSNGQWEFVATTLEYGGTLSSSEWVKAYKLGWEFHNRSQAYTGTTTSTIYVMNFKAYTDFITQTINNKKAEIYAYAGQYTTESIRNFVNAANNFINYNPKNYTSVTNAPTWGTQIASYASAFNTAASNLKKRNVNVTYENLFSINDWAASESSGYDSSKGEVVFEDNATVKIYKSIAGGELTTASSYSGNHRDTMYSIPVTGGKDYTVRFNITSSVSGTPASEVFLFWYDANNKPVNNTAGSATFNNKGFSDNGIKSVTFTAPASAVKAEIRFDNDSATSASTIRFNDIAVYPAERNTAVEVDSWSIRPVTKAVTYGSTLSSGKLDVPVRDGYLFNGWYVEKSVNGVKDSGEEVTDAAGNIITTLTVDKSINLYADWKPLPMDIGYDNMFSLAEWAKTGSNKVNSKATSFEVDVMNGTISVTGSSDAYTIYGGGSDCYHMPVTAGEEYIFDYDVTSTNGTYQAFVFFYNDAGEGVQSSVQNAPHIGVYNGAPISFTAPAGCTKIGIRVGICGTTEGTATYSNIGFYKKADYDAYAKDYAVVRVPFNFGDTTNLALVPTREGYQFDGWYTANGTKLTSVSGLTKSDTVYAKWTKLFTVTFKNWNGTVLKTQQVAPGAAATAPQNPNRAADKDYEYDFIGWDKTFTNVASDLVVTATYKSKDHTGISKTYKSGATCTSAATYTQLCKACGFVWTEVFEDPAMPALDHTWERANPESTVVTGTSTGKADTDLHTIKCNACDATTQVKHDFKDDATRPGTTATCTVKGWTYTKCACLETQEIEGQTNPDNHVNTEIINKKDAKCGVEGYTGDKYCNDCKKIVETGTVIKALEHKYTNYVYNDDATCTADGTKTATCDNGCGTKDTIKAEGTMILHSFTNYVSNGDATCDADGTKTAECDYNCGAKDTVTDVGSKRVHKFDGTVKNNEDGTHSFECSYDNCAVYGGTVNCSSWKPDGENCKCTVCGYTKAHTYGIYSQAEGNTGDAAGKMIRTCSVCGNTDTTDCEYNAVSTSATCETDAYITYTCKDTNCGHGYTVWNRGSATGHKFDGAYKYDAENDKHQQACTNKDCTAYGVGTVKDEWADCSWTYANAGEGKHTASCVCGNSEELTCSGGEATCTAQAVCQFCNTAYGEKAAHDITGTEKYLKKATDATCIANETYYKYCINCESEFSATETYEKPDTMTAHDYTCKDEYLYIATQAKCDVNETYYAYCSNPDCKKSSEDVNNTFEKADTALEHVWVNAQHNADTLTHTFICERGCGETMTANCADAAVSYGYEPATCTEQGYDIVQCSACGHQWNINYTVALGHDYTQKIYDEAHLKLAANCEHANIYYYDCSRCDKNAKDETDKDKYTTLTYISGEVRKHDFHNKVDAKYLAVPATCTAAAKYYPSCLYDDCNAKDTSKTFSNGEALGHDFTEQIKDEAHLISAADCVSGSKYYYDCSRCDENAKNDANKDEYTYELDDFSGHSMAYTAAKAATCDAAGNLEYWYCDACKKYYKDAEGKDAYLGQSETVIKAVGHKNVKVSSKMPTCEEDGHPEYTYCSVCETEGYKGELPNGYKATGHKFTGAYTYDTVNLYHSRLCANGCGVSGMVVDGAQVKYEVTFNGEDEAVIVGGEKCEFTYTESTKDGIHTHANACVCGNNNTRVYSDEETFVETVAPTCTAKGYDSYACKICGATWTKNEKPANGHTAAEKATSNGDGTHSVYCTVEGCGYKISTANCSGGTATCSAKAICKVCGGEYGEATGKHTLAEDGWTVISEATCTAPMKRSQICSSCNNTIEETVGEALVHDEKIMSDFVYELPEGVTLEGFDASELREPNCKKGGYAVSYCTLRCGYYVTKNTPKDENKHAWGEPVTEGSCGTGYYTVKTCTLCGRSTSEPAEGEGHSWVITTYIPATCSKPGFRELTCTKCGFIEEHHYDKDLHDKLGEEYEDADLEEKPEAHTYKYVGIAEATCTEPSKEVWKCVDCGELKESVVDGSEALGHALVYYKGSESDCRIEGTLAHWTCKECKVIFADEAATQVLTSVVIPRKDHADKDGNGKCDECNAAVYGEDSGKFCGCICHKENFLMKIIYKIVNFFWGLFKISKTCDCGAAHW